MTEINYDRNLKPDIREKTLKRGVAYPTDYELVMLILGSGTQRKSVRQLACEVMDMLYKTDDDSVIENLRSISGMGDSKSLAIAAALELGRRRNSRRNTAIRRPCDVIPFVQHYAMQKKEHFVYITLNGAHEILQIKLASIGTETRTLVNAREIFSDAMLQNASALIVCHNHPSENLKPSPDDIATTEKMIEISRVVDIAMLDHIIINRSGYFSFLENNLLFSNE